MQNEWNTEAFMTRKPIGMSSLIGVVSQERLQN